MTPLSEILKNIRDTFAGHAIADGRIVIEEEALFSLVETLDMAVDAARALERERSAPASVHLPANSPRHHANRRGWRGRQQDAIRRHSAVFSPPRRGNPDGNDSGGDAA